MSSSINKVKDENKLVKISLHGDLGRGVGHKLFNLAVSSVQEAIRGIDTLTDRKFSNYFIQNNKMYAKYRVLINGRDFSCPVKELNLENVEEINNSELVMEKANLETIDIVPILEGSGDVANFFQALLGVILIIVGILLLPVSGPGGFALIVAGLGMVISGVMGLLAKPPKFQDFRKIDKSGGESYLFGGPTNTIGEGGPVPVGYGRIIVGSQVISSSYKVVDYQTLNMT